MCIAPPPLRPCAGNLDLPFINMLYNANNLVVMASRLPQIWTNVRHKSTGQLSLITCTINVVGSAVRIYTSSQEKAGGALMRAYGLSKPPSRACACACMCASRVASEVLWATAQRRACSSTLEGRHTQPAHALGCCHGILLMRSLPRLPASALLPHMPCALALQACRSTSSS